MRNGRAARGRRPVAVPGSNGAARGGARAGLGPRIRVRSEARAPRGRRRSWRALEFRARPVAPHSGSCLPRVGSRLGPLLSAGTVRRDPLCLQAERAPTSRGLAGALLEAGRVCACGGGRP